MGITSDNKRLVLEHKVMQERWGNRPRWCCNKKRTKFWWEYDVRLEGRALPIKIEYPSDYPASPPTIVPLVKLPSGTEHMIGNRLCWYYPGERKRTKNKWSPAKDTAALAIGVAHRWFLAFLVWEATGEWPVKDATD